MHELSMALSLLDLVGDEAERRGCRVAAIHVQLGPLSGVVREALESAFGLAREGTSMAETDLRIEEVPVVVLCPRCEAERTPRSPYELLCPDCGTPTPRILRGQELDVVALEIFS